MDYLKAPAEIYRLSEQLVRDSLAKHHPTLKPSNALIRMVHACADPKIARDYRSSPYAEAIGVKALQQQANILCDCTMVQQGIISKRLNQNKLICTLNNHEVETIAQKIKNTRSAAAVTLWKNHLAGSIVVIGNAPTALFQLLEMLEEGAPPPALIIGLPVGFVGAAESKQLLYEKNHHIAYITLLGRKGGSAMAAAALNSLAGGLGN